MDLWAAMRDGKVGVARHQARLAANRLKQREYQEAYNIIDSWANSHELAEGLGKGMMGTRSIAQVRIAVIAMLKEFDALPNEV